MFCIAQNVVANQYTPANPSLLKTQQISLQDLSKQLSGEGQIKELYRDMPFKFDQSPDFCPNLNDDYFKGLVFNRKQCFSISYQNTSYRTYSILLSKALTGDENRKLLIYNHGHSGFPSESENFATLFLLSFSIFLFTLT
jgi:hypothetical protein